MAIEIPPPTKDVLSNASNITESVSQANQTMENVTTTAGNVLFELFTGSIWWIIIGIVGALLVIVFLIYLLKSRGSSKQSLVGTGGYLNPLTVLRFRPNAIALVLDSSLKTPYYIPLYDQGKYYTYKYGNRRITFIPFSSPKFTIGGKPLYVTLRSGDSLVEYDYELSMKLLAGSVVDKRLAEISNSPFMHALKKLHEQLKNVEEDLGERSGSLSSTTDLLIDVSPVSVLEDFSMYISNVVSSIVSSLTSLSTIVMETGGALEKRSSGAEYSWILYLFVGVGILMMVFLITRMFGA